MIMTMNRWVIEGVSSGVETMRILGSVVKTTDRCRFSQIQLNNG